MPPAEIDSLLIAMKSYTELMFAENPDLTEEYFDLEKCGYLKMGIGSALDKKYLLRCRGETANPLDDVVLEVKEVRDLSAIECLTLVNKADPFRVLVGQSRIAYQPFKHLGYFRLFNKYFWVHSWVENYAEIDISETFHTIDELKEVVYDIGIQLGKGHPKQIAAPFDLQLRKAQIRWLDIYDSRIKSACGRLTKELVNVWEQFCMNIK
jgi:hypothetical protein